MGIVKSIQSLVALTNGLRYRPQTAALSVPGVDFKENFPMGISKSAFFAPGPSPTKTFLQVPSLDLELTIKLIPLVMTPIERDAIALF